MKINFKYFLVFTALLALCVAITGCGSGGSTPSARNSNKATLKTAGLLPAGYLVSNIDIVISIPYGVSLKYVSVTDPNTQKLIKYAADPSIFSYNGTTTNAMSLQLNTTYIPPQPPTNGVPNSGTLRIVYLNAEGFTPSDSISFELDIANGFSPKESDFSTPTYTFDVGGFQLGYELRYDSNGNIITDTNNNPKYFSYIVNTYPITPVPDKDLRLKVNIQ